MEFMECIKCRNTYTHFLEYLYWSSGMHGLIDSGDKVKDSCEMGAAAFLYLSRVQRGGFLCREPKMTKGI